MHGTSGELHTSIHVVMWMTWWESHFLGRSVGSLCRFCINTSTPAAASMMLVDGSYVRTVCKPGSGVGPVVNKQLGKGNCTLSCIYIFVLFLLRERARNTPCM